MALASFHPFTLTPFFRENLSGFMNWNLALAVLTVCLGLLMVSHVPYPVFPRIGVRNARGIIGLLFTVGILVCALTIPEYFFFPFILTYILFGVGRALGCMANITWDRGLGYAIERPKSVTTEMLEKWAAQGGRELPQTKAAAC